MNSEAMYKKDNIGNEASRREKIRQCIQKINALPRISPANTLDRLRAFVDFMGSPDEEMNIIHVAGTNGKGSVCEFTSSILQESGYSTGMFISPHLVNMNERFRINGKPVSDDIFLSACEKVDDALDHYNESSDGNSNDSQNTAKWYPIFSEYLLCMAFVIFREKAVDWVILETGLGGRLDATNCIKAPKLCVITEIGLDHMQYLGNTIAEIAGEKAGIIKPGVPVVFADRVNESTGVICNVAEKSGSLCLALCRNGKKSECVKHAADVSRIRMTDTKQIDFSYISEYDRYNDLVTGSTAFYQAENAGLSVLSAELIQRIYDCGSRISRQSIISGIRKAFWEGRMEELETGFYIDGAHNCDGIRAFIESARAVVENAHAENEADDGNGCSNGKTMLIFGAVRDKQYEEMLKELVKSNLFCSIALCRLDTDRTVSLEELKGMTHELSKENKSCIFRCFESVSQALSEVLPEKGSSDIVFAAGSLFLAGQIKRLSV